MSDEPYLSSFKIRIIKYQLPGMADDSHPDGGEFLYLLVEGEKTQARGSLW